MWQFLQGHQLTRKIGPENAAQMMLDLFQVEVLRGTLSFIINMDVESHAEILTI